MSSAYGSLQVDKSGTIVETLTVTLKDGSKAQIVPLDSSNQGRIHSIFNEIVSQGTTYPQEQELSLEQFLTYFSTAFVLVLDSIPIGAFYVKPNFPGRCSHICNGGFIVDQAYRNLGVGTCLAKCFIKYAPRLGYKAAMFNLVFATNEASVNLWKKVGFQVIGKLPKAGRLKGQDNFVDALMFYKEF